MCRASIIVPAYNAGAYIEKTLNSILAQDFTDFEIIVVNDGSTDSTEDKVRSLALLDTRIKYISQPNSGGPARPRNVGIENAKGDYIFIFDADDVMLQGKIRLSVNAMDEYPNANLLFTNFSTINEDDIFLKNDFLEEYETLWNLVGGRTKEISIIDPEKIHFALVKVNFIGTSSVVLRRSALKETDRFNEGLKNSDDRLFWIRFSKINHFLFLNKVLHQYRILKTGISNQGFVKRGPSKIQALEIARQEEDNHQLKKTLTNQISSDYAGLAYASRLVNDVRSQRLHSIKSLRNKLNAKAIKLLLLSITLDWIRR